MTAGPRSPATARSRPSSSIRSGSPKPAARFSRRAPAASTSHPIAEANGPPASPAGPRRSEGHQQEGEQEQGQGDDRTDDNHRRKRKVGHGERSSWAIDVDSRIILGHFILFRMQPVRTSGGRG